MASLNLHLRFPISYISNLKFVARIENICSVKYPMQLDKALIAMVKKYVHFLRYDTNVSTQRESATMADLLCSLD